MNLPTLIYRHKRENLRKCSLRGLETRSDLRFFTYPVQALPPLEQYIVLKVGAPPLSLSDQNRGLLLIDATWRLAEIMFKHLPLRIEERSLPSGYKTAYPRRQTECPDPSAGLASVEALYLAHLHLNKSTEGLLDHYFWKEQFLLAVQGVQHQQSAR